jgi:hypothetical protein
VVVLPQPPLALLIDKVAICLCRCWIVPMAGQHFVQMALSTEGGSLRSMARAG